MSQSPALHARDLVELLRARADDRPDGLAYRFLSDGKEETSEITYGELDTRARAIAALLQDAGAAGERVLLLHPPGIHFIAAFLGSLYAGAVVIPAYPPRLNQTLARLEAIATDARARLILTTRSIRAQVARQLTKAPVLNSLPWMITTEIDGDGGAWRPPSIGGDTLAMLQYTSGSTGDPKGVMVSHANVLANSATICSAFGHTAASRGVIWLPPYHDMGLIGGIVQPLYAGFPVTLMSPFAFLQRPLRWLQVISETGGSTSGGPNFAYDLCVRRIPEEQRATLDLSSWDVAFCGAEPLRRATLDRFADAFAPCGFRREAFYPCYGLAEATLFVTGGEKHRAPVFLECESAALERHGAVVAGPDARGARTLVGCGATVPGLRVEIVDPASGARRVPGMVGEIWVQGSSVAQGYWNQPDLTARTFAARMAGNGAGPYLRTGDLGFLHGDELFVTGRLKDLIVIRGRNFYPQDIEATMEDTDPALRRAATAAFSIDVDGEEQLVVAHEVERAYVSGLDVPGVIASIRAALIEAHGLQPHSIALLKHGTMPKTSSGKVQRLACRSAFLDGTLSLVGSWQQDAPVEAAGERPDAAAPRGPSSGEITSWFIWHLSTQPQLAAVEIDPDQPLGRYGLDSLAISAIAGKLEAWLQRPVPQGVMWESHSIRGLARLLAGGAPAPAPEAILPEYHKFELFPEYRQLRELRASIEAAGLPIPYFRTHESVATDTTLIDGEVFINFCSYNYLGLCGEPAVSRASQEAIDQYGTSVSGSRLVSGERPLHTQLERAIAELIGTDDAMVYIGGHAANMATISHLVGAGDVIFYDAFSHNSILQGAALSGARVMPFPHNDWRALDELLRRERYRCRRALIVIEGLYSMDGDIPEVPEFIAVKDRHKALLMIDEAHSMGVLGSRGRGIREHFDLRPDAVEIWMGTLSKSFASCGGYIAGSRALIEYLKYTAPGFVYSVGITPSNAAAALAAIRVLNAEPERVNRLHARARLFVEDARSHGIELRTSPDSPVLPVIVGDSHRCLHLAQELYARHITAQPIIYPAVEEAACRLRFFITCTHTETQIRHAVSALAEVLRAYELPNGGRAGTPGLDVCESPRVTQ